MHASVADNMGFLWEIFDIETICQCSLPCDFWTYDTSVSYRYTILMMTFRPRSDLPNPGYASLWNQRLLEAGADMTNDTFSDDYIIIDLFFENLVYTLIKETKLQTLV